jgi:hypothetical protein
VARVCGASRDLKKRANIDRQVGQHFIQKTRLTRWRGDRELAAFVGEDCGETFARIDHALDEDDVASGHANAPE